MIAKTLLLFWGIALVIADRPPVVCRDPDVGGTAQNKNRKFVLLGNENSEGAGMGNLMIFFPSVYYFAAFTGRDIVIADNSIIGEMCHIVACGFPFVSEIALAFPNILSPAAVRGAADIKVADMIHYIEGTKDVSAPIVTGWGYKSTSDWWVYFNTTVHCVSKITGCDPGDIPCADRHAYQRLIRGPFKSGLSAREESRIQGVPDHIKHAMLTLPHSYAPRLDAAIHLRVQFSNFESLNAINDPDYKKEVADWLASEECSFVFKNMETMLLDSLTENRKLLNMTDDEPSYVYLASDNEEVKDNFTAILEQPHGHFTIKIMRVETEFVQHVKSLSKMKAATNNEGLLDLVFDWYALSLANVVFAWRKGSTNMVSTFVHSAQRVSGTTERTDVHATVGHGIGTIGYQLTRDRRGNARWDHMWSYSFLEDYQQKRKLFAIKK